MWLYCFGLILRFLLCCIRSFVFFLIRSITELKIVNLENKTNVWKTKSGSSRNFILSVIKSRSIYYHELLNSIKIFYSFLILVCFLTAQMKQIKWEYFVSSTIVYSQSVCYEGRSKIIHYIFDTNSFLS